MCKPSSLLTILRKHKEHLTQNSIFFYLSLCEPLPATKNSNHKISTEETSKTLNAFLLIMKQGVRKNLLRTIRSNINLNKDIKVTGWKAREITISVYVWCIFDRRRKTYQEQASQVTFYEHKKIEREEIFIVLWVLSSFRVLLLDLFKLHSRSSSEQFVVQFFFCFALRSIDVRKNREWNDRWCHNLKKANQFFSSHYTNWFFLLFTVVSFKASRRSSLNRLRF